LLPAALLQGPKIFQDAASYFLTDATAHGTVAANNRPYRSYNSIPRLRAATGGATATVVNLAQFVAAPEVNTGWTVTTLRGFYVPVPAGSGTITDHIGVDIDDLNAYPGTKTNPRISLRSLGALVEARHVGPVVIGANAAPTNANVLLDLVSTTRALLVPRMTTVQKNAMAALKGMIVYDITTDTFEGFQGAVGAWAAL
jgi:hypothetical protein